MVRGMPGSYDGNALMDCLIRAEVIFHNELEAAMREQLRHLIFDRGIDQDKAFSMVNESFGNWADQQKGSANLSAQLALITIRRALNPEVPDASRT